MIACETQIQIKSPLWRVVLNSAKNDALTALFMNARTKLIGDYRRLWPSEMPICDAVVNGMFTYGIVPDGYNAINGRILLPNGCHVDHMYLFNPSDGYIFDPTAAQFYGPNNENPGGAVYAMMENNPGRVIVEEDIGLGVLFAPYSSVEGIVYE